jgi:hypothetical protein
MLAFFVNAHKTKNFDMVWMPFHLEASEALVKIRTFFAMKSQLNTWPGSNVIKHFTAVN